jgi:putative flippase GtrA
MKLAHRWVVFSLVGVAGFAVQVAALWGLVEILGMHYLAATGLAVETAVLHNFAWHEAKTWRDRPAGTVLERVKRLVRFHSTNGFTSLAVNLGLMRLLAGHFGLPVIPSNLVSVLAGSIANFFLSEYAVFRVTGSGEHTYHFDLKAPVKFWR